MDEDIVMSDLDLGSTDWDPNEEQDSHLVAEESGEARWRASMPPEETRGKYKIIGEEVDYEGNIKCAAVVFSICWILIILHRLIIDMR